MALLDPTTTSVGDICHTALRECGALGVGQTALADDTNDAWARLQWMLQQWARKRWFVYHLVDLSKVSTGAQSYTVGPGGDFDTGAATTRPAKLESGFLRQIQIPPPNQIDYPLEIIQAREDYNRIALKSLKSFPGSAFLDTDWPLANLLVWPVPNPTIYEIHITVLAQLPTRFASLAVNFVLPFEYYDAMLFNLAIRLRPKYGIRSGPGDHLPGLAKDALNVLRGANTQIARLSMPPGLMSGSQYNIFSDRIR